MVATVVRVPELDGVFIELETMTDGEGVGAALAAIRSMMLRLFCWRRASAKARLGGWTGSGTKPAAPCHIDNSHIVSRRRRPRLAKSPGS